MTRYFSGFKPPDAGQGAPELNRQAGPGTRSGVVAFDGLCPAVLRPLTAPHPPCCEPDRAKTGSDSRFVLRRYLFEQLCGMRYIVLKHDQVWLYTVTSDQTGGI